MAWRPEPAGPKTIRSLYHWIWKQTTDLGSLVVFGPASAVDNTVPRYDTTTGNLLQGSNVVIDDSDNVSGINSLTVGDITATGGTSANWNTAFGWGNHAAAGYVTASSTATFTNKSGNISQWTNDSGYLTTQYVLPAATSTVRGGIEILSDTVQAVAANAVTATAGKTYGVQLDSSDRAVVNVPWTATAGDKNTDGGFANSTYLPVQSIDGGNA